MNHEQLDKIRQVFFTCNRKEFLGLLNEMLYTMEAEELLPPDHLISRNYDTAQANPEIHTLPGNLRDARDAIFPYFWGTDGWFSKLHLENVKGPANYASLVGAIACLLKNPNLCVDTYSQRSNELEVKAITSLANLIFYHTQQPWGVFTMGGTISNLYGGRIGLEKVVPGAMQKGLQGERPAGLVSEAAHYSNRTVAGWLGMGTEALYTVATDNSCAMRIDALARRLDELYSDGRKVAFVMATFGTTDAFGIDDIGDIRQLIEDKARQYDMPIPQLHVDAAVGWVLCFFHEYDTAGNPLELGPDVLADVEQAKRKAGTLRYADSITIDFHKMGWGHYPASAFIVNRRDDLQCLFRDVEQVPYFSEAQYRRDPALFTLECSRPAIGPYSVMASLNGIGLVGYQILIAHGMELARYLRQRLKKLDYCKVLNDRCTGTHAVWWVLPKGRDAGDIIKKLEAGELADADAKRYFSEVKHLFEKRAAARNPERDAMLSFTTSMGYNPRGQALPAWKAVFFNPHTNHRVVDNIITSIEEL